MIADQIAPYGLIRFPCQEICNQVVIVSILRGRFPLKLPYFTEALPTPLQGAVPLFRLYFRDGLG